MQRVLSLVAAVGVLSLGVLSSGVLSLGVLASRPAAARPHLQTSIQSLSQSPPQRGQARPVPPKLISPMKAIKDYRSRPDPRTVPALIRTLSQQGSLSEPETSGVYVGFLAGVLGSNPKGAQTIINQILPLPFEDQWALIRAVAYSGHPRSRKLLRRLLVRLPDRWTFTERYLSGALPSLDRIQLEAPVPSASEKLKRAFEYDTYFGPKKKPPRHFTFASHPELIDVCWGLYFATGKEAPIQRLLSLLPWSAEQDDLNKLTIGAMTKVTLAANAAHDLHLLKTLKRLKRRQTKEIEPILKDVIEAADTADAARIKKELVATVEELRTKGPGTKRDIAAWGQVGQTAISLGCLGAAVAGQAEFGLPCVIGGALSTATIRYLAAPE
jgi:hypothetical protein